MPRMAFFSTEPTPSFLTALQTSYGRVTFLPKAHQRKKKDSEHNSLSQHGWLIIDMAKSKCPLIPPLGKQHGVDVIESGWWRLDNGANALK